MLEAGKIFGLIILDQQHQYESFHEKTKLCFIFLKEKKVFY